MKRMYVIVDKVAESAGNIALLNNDKQATRLFKQSCKDFINDCNLYYIGDFDEETGNISEICHELVALDETQE